MNRTLKFRAWDKNKKRMVYADELVFWNGCCYFNESKALNNPDKPHSAAKLKGYTLLEQYVMQYTGLLDKNGKEIYEGDIVEHELRNTRTEIVWLNTDAGFAFGAEPTRPNLDEHARLYLEVIGNIYQNPELLEVKP